MPIRDVSSVSRRGTTQGRRGDVADNRSALPHHHGRYVPVAHQTIERSQVVAKGRGGRTLLPGPVFAERREPALLAVGRAAVAAVDSASQVDGLLVQALREVDDGLCVDDSLLRCTLRSVIGVRGRFNCNFVQRWSPLNHTQDPVSVPT